MAVRKSARIAFVSCNETPWGGSEELWSRAALAMLDDGAQVFVAKPNIDRNAEPIKELKANGVKMTDLLRIWFVPGRLRHFVNFLLRPVMFAWQLFQFWFFLKRVRPDLIVLSQGGSWDGFYLSGVLKRLAIPYVLICQKASDLYWPPDFLMERVRNFLNAAHHIYFVSQHNHRLMEQQTGQELPRASVVRNPFLVDYANAMPWPTEDGLTRLACIGRLYPMEKGQDILLRVLAQPKWLERPITVDFYGDGTNKNGLAAMAQYLGCTNVRFAGHVSDIAEVWNMHHGLVLASRAEGLPLVLVETMLAGRVAIISQAGGSGEVVDDGETAFVVQGYDEGGLDAAMERAWQARDKWRDIGLKAAHSIRQMVPADPARDLADRIAVELDAIFDPARA